MKIPGVGHHATFDVSAESQQSQVPQVLRKKACTGLRACRAAGERMPCDQPCGERLHDTLASCPRRRAVEEGPPGHGAADLPVIERLDEVRPLDWTKAALGAIEIEGRYQRRT